jgi:hypothetical protein
MRNRSKWLFSALIGCLAIGPFLAVAVLAGPQGPCIIVSEPGYNFGELSETASMSHDFIIKNIGKTTLNILDVQTSCGCTIARFDRTISAGARGKVTLEVNLKGFQGHVKKTATILSDDPENPRVVLQVEGAVKPLIEVLPEKLVYFQGLADNMAEKNIHLVSTSKKFHILRMDDNLEKKVSYKIETVEEEKHYILRVSNNAARGSYRGSITLYTDFAEKPELTVWVNGFIEGEIGVRPRVLVVGRLSPDQGVISAKVLVLDNKNRAFKIAKCTYDERVISVRQEPLPDGPGFSLDVSPRMENITPGSRIKTTMTIETDLAAEGKQEVEVQAINLAEIRK